MQVHLFDRLQREPIFPGFSKLRRFFLTQKNKGLPPLLFFYLLHLPQHEFMSIGFPPVENAQGKIGTHPLLPKILPAPAQSSTPPSIVPDPTTKVSSHGQITRKKAKDATSVGGSTAIARTLMFQGLYLFYRTPIKVSITTIKRKETNEVIGVVFLMLLSCFGPFEWTIWWWLEHYYLWTKLPNLSPSGTHRSVWSVMRWRQRG